MTRAHARCRGMTLIEVMISMSVLLVGMLGMMHLQIYGLTSNQGARAQMQATQLAREVAVALERIPLSDPRLDPTADFGSLMNGASVLPGHLSASTLPGVRPDSEIEGGAAAPVFQRRYTVRVEGSVGGQAGTKLVAVSVIYRERANPTPREVVVYTHRSDGATLAQNLGAYF